MSKAFRYTLYRRSIFSEMFYIEANSIDEALELANEGAMDMEPVASEWMDYYDDHYEIDETEDPEPLDPLYKMIKEHKCDTTS